MKQTCQLTGLTYETLKYYCNEGLIPGVTRDAHNHRVFDDDAIAWLRGIGCLRRCGLSIAEMRHYVDLCLAGDATIPERQRILASRRAALVAQLAEVQESIAYIDAKQRYYEGVLAGENPTPPDPQPTGPR
ncbi:MAG: MerR family transcriptional regulator [Actinomycetaceae bacterium]|nr:MerR family transcriptional regulator [Actinomycetaceae bacterium]MDU0970615.1 MerR family transcriptional regulator [Actinomycetaceae bacterium]